MSLFLLIDPSLFYFTVSLSFFISFTFCLLIFFLCSSFVKISFFPHKNCKVYYGFFISIIHTACISHFFKSFQKSMSRKPLCESIVYYTCSLLLLSVLSLMSYFLFSHLFLKKINIFFLLPLFS